MAAKKIKEIEPFEESFTVKEFAKIINRSPRYIQSIRDKHGFPFYKEGRLVCYKVSDYVKWRESRRQEV